MYRLSSHTLGRPDAAKKKAKFDSQKISVGFLNIKPVSVLEGTGLLLPEFALFREAKARVVD